MTSEIVTYKGESHYTIPHLYPDGNSCKCYKCRYFVEDQRIKRRSRFGFDGECHSKAHQTEKGYTHRKIGWDMTMSYGGCKWWFPIEKQPGEQEELI